MFDIFVSYWWQFCILAVICYFVGNINFAVIFSRLIQKRDVRTCGSGNAGATNMFRVFGLRMGVLTFTCDCLKGVVCCLCAKYIFALLGEQAAVQAQYFAGLFVVLGHIFPVLYGFRGGKGVATSIGVLLVNQPILMLCCIIPAIVIILISDRMSVFAILTSLFMIIWCWTVMYADIGAFASAAFTLMFVFVIFAHRHNIARIFTGKESRLGVLKALRGKSEHRLRELKEREERRNAAQHNDGASEEANASEGNENGGE